MKKIIMSIALIGLLTVLGGVCFADSTSTSSADFSWSLTGTLAGAVDVGGNTKPQFSYGSYYSYEPASGSLPGETYQDWNIPGGATGINLSYATNATLGTGSAAFGTNATYSDPFNFTGSGNIYANTATVRDAAHKSDYSAVYNTSLSHVAFIDFEPSENDTAVLNIDIDWAWSYANIVKPLNTDWQASAEIMVYSNLLLWGSLDPADNMSWTGVKSTSVYHGSYPLGLGASDSGTENINFELNINPFSSDFSYTDYSGVPWNNSFTPIYARQVFSIYISSMTWEQGTPTDNGGGNGSTVPEPTTMLLLGIGFVGLASLRRKIK